MIRAALMLWVLAAAGCRCNGEGTGPVDLGFRVETAELDFGRVLEGDVVSKDATLVGTGRLDITVAVQTGDPFTATHIARMRTHYERFAL